jgi:hypothetical protein
LTRQLLFFFLFSFTVNQLSSQSISREVLSSGGQENYSGTFTLYSTVGELAVSTLQTSSSILAQGFEQPENILITGVQPTDASACLISVFPNPAIDKVTIASVNKEGFGIKIFDIKGQLLKASLFMGLSLNTYVLDLTDFQPGTYFISIIQPETRLIISNFKLVKL